MLQADLRRSFFSLINDVVLGVFIMFLAADEMMKKMDERDDKLDETISPILGNIQETGNFEAAGTAKFILNNLRQGGLLTGQQT